MLFLTRPWPGLATWSNGQTSYEVCGASDVPDSPSRAALLSPRMGTPSTALWPINTMVPLHGKSTDANVKKHICSSTMHTMDGPM